MGSSGKADDDARKPDTRVLHYGSRKGSKLVRIYNKEELGVLRIEGEFHSSFLRQRRVETEQDIGSVADDFYPAHVRFVDIDWRRLRRHLRKKYGKERAGELLESAKKRRSSIRRVTRYLRRNGVLNVQRFYRPLEINKEIERALKKWSTQFDWDWQMARQKTDRGER
jgi:hypothetical protein